MEYKVAVNKPDGEAWEEKKMNMTEWSRMRRGNK